MSPTETQSPSYHPSSLPSEEPSNIPSLSPSASPSLGPTVQASSSPTAWCEEGIIIQNGRAVQLPYTTDPFDIELDAGTAGAPVSIRVAFTGNWAGESVTVQYGVTESLQIGPSSDSCSEQVARVTIPAEDYNSFLVDGKLLFKFAIPAGMDAVCGVVYGTVEAIHSLCLPNLILG